jgi:hypothetical protein
MPLIRSAGVLTGDLVKSSHRKAKRPEIMRGLSSAVESSRSYLREYRCRLYFSNFYRGDAFQCVVTDPGHLLWTAVFIRTELIKMRADGIYADARLGLGFGPVSAWNRRNITASDGEAFRLSGKALDSLKSGKEKYRRLRILSPWPEESACLAVLVSFLDALMQRWTPEQAAAMSFFLRDKSQEEISRVFKIKQPAVQGRLQKAGHFAVKEAIDLFKQMVGGPHISSRLDNAGL